MVPNWRKNRSGSKPQNRHEVCAAKRSSAVFEVFAKCLDPNSFVDSRLIRYVTYLAIGTQENKVKYLLKRF